jgi:hypothetical protein
VPTRILGISAYYHDSAACLVEDGCIVAAAQEERFTRRKHDARFPSCAIEYCLDEGSIRAQDLDLVGFYEKPLDESHAASAFYPSPFEQAAILTMDGVGNGRPRRLGSAAATRSICPASSGSLIPSGWKPGCLTPERDCACSLCSANRALDCRDVVAYRRTLNQGWDWVFGSRFIRGGVIDYPVLK